MSAMSIDSNQHALRIAMDLFKGRQPLAAAIVYAEVARSGHSVPELWCGLGAALMASRGRLVRRGRGAGPPREAGDQAALDAPGRRG